MNFDSLRVVLVGTTHPGNIGAVARAMKNMGLRRLWLVQPRYFPHAEATARAAGADDVLAQAQVAETLAAALDGCHWVFGTSARQRGVSGPELNPRQCAERVAVYSEQAEVALVFGRESSGLSNEELDRCQFRVYIPTDPAFGSLNLGAAVLVLAYELRMAALAGTPPLAEPRYPPATVEQMESFYQHLERTLLATGFLDPLNPRRLMRRLRRLFHRALPDQRELNILRGILTSIEGKRRPPGA